MQKHPPAEPGHLKDNYPNLQCTLKVRSSLSRAQAGVEALKKFKPVTLEWKQPK